MINADIDQIISQSGLTEPCIYKNNKKAQIILLRGCVEGRDTLVKIIPKIITAKVDNFLREESASKLLAKSLPQFKMTLIRKSGYAGAYFWIARDFFEGESLAPYSSTIYGLMGYDVIADHFLPDMNQILSSTNDFLVELGKVDREADLGISRFKRKLEECDIDNIEQGLGVSLANQLAYYNSMFKEYWSAPLLAYSVNDMVPANIIIGSNNDVVFSDFEWMSYDHRYTDATFIWLYFWRYPKWQKIWFDLAFNKQELEPELFRCAVIRHIINWYNKLYDPSREMTEKLSRNQGIYKDHIFTKYLDAAGQSFKSILNIAE